MINHVKKHKIMSIEPETVYPTKVLKRNSFFQNLFVSHQYEIHGVESFFEHDNSEAVYSASSFFKALPERLLGKL